MGNNYSRKRFNAKVLISIKGRLGRGIKVYQVYKSATHGPSKLLTWRNISPFQEKITFLTSESSKFWKLYSHGNCFKISLPLRGWPPPILPSKWLFFFFRPSLYFVSSGCTNYLFIFILSVFLFIHYSLSLSFFPPSLCVWLLGLICSLLPPTARSLLQPRCFYTNFSVQLSY